MPLQFALGRAGGDPAGQPDIMGDAPGQHAIDAAVTFEQVEDQADSGLDLLIRIQGDLARRAADIAARQDAEQCAAPGLPSCPRPFGSSEGAARRRS